MHAPFEQESLPFAVPAVSDGRRIMALWLPFLRTDRILRQRWGRDWRRTESHPGPHEPGNGQPGRQSDGRHMRPPLLVSHRDGQAQRILAIDERAGALGLKPGLGVADARAMHSCLDVVEADPVADRRCLESLADWCDRYTPLTALDGDDGLFLDITGCTHLFGGEEAMLRDVLARLRRQGFDTRGAVASTVGAAWAAARFFPDGGLVEPGGEARLIGPLPLAALRIEPAICLRLEGVGLRKIGDIMKAPRAPLARRFGAALLVRLDQALGAVEEAVSPRLPVADLSVERILAEPISLVDDIEKLSAALARVLSTDLERRGEGARRLQLSLFRLDGGVQRLEVGASQPLRDPDFVARLFHEKLVAVGEAIDPGYGFELVRLSVLGTAPLAEEQADFAGGSERSVADLALLADRLRARLGDAILEQPVMVASHLPERAQRSEPFSVPIPAARDVENGHMQSSRSNPAERPVRLLPRPEPVDVAAAEVPEGPPASFRWRRALHRVMRAEGPERIAPEWWRQPAKAESRDYFRVEDEAGRRYWLYREGFYGTASAPRWYMHGLGA
ncbi:MAG: DNA polymerase Y family protein [Rhizobiaceae bacterium]|nr:DNA polymerase Y family protein [Rhizobiaceae bacterium]